MPFQHLLVPVDLGDANEAALDAALEMALQNKAETTLLHVIETIDQEPNEEDDELERFYFELETSVRQKLGELSRRFEAEGLAVRQEIVVGRRVRDIIQYTATQSVDLVVMNSRRVDLNRPEEVKVTLTHQLSMFCQCPVLLVK